jgi:hypothetical protein
MAYVDYRRRTYPTPALVPWQMIGTIMLTATVDLPTLLQGVLQRPTGIAAKFRRLADQWEADTINMSSIRDMVQHPAYLAIIGMGPAIIPLLIADLEREPKHWFPALQAITHVNPVPDEDAGDIDRMTVLWLRWATQHGHR